MQHLPFKTHLGDGTAVTVRPVLRSDRALIEEGFDHLSDASRFMRFLGARTSLTAAELDALTDPDDHDDVAVGMVAAGAGRPDVPVGVARFVRLAPGGTRAELAITVVDDFQAKGAGTILLESLAQEAQRCGIATLLAIVHRRNTAMRRMLARAGGVETLSDGGEVHVEVPIPLASERPRRPSEDAQRKRAP
jgi:RimJ/RimL family protein N-acetyltransferase